MGTTFGSSILEWDYYRMAWQVCTIEVLNESWMLPNLYFREKQHLKSDYLSSGTTLRKTVVFQKHKGELFIRSFKFLKFLAFMFQTHLVF